MERKKMHRGTESVSDTALMIPENSLLAQVFMWEGREAAVHLIGKLHSLRFLHKATSIYKVLGLYPYAADVE